MSLERTTHVFGGQLMVWMVCPMSCSHFACVLSIALFLLNVWHELLRCPEGQRSGALHLHGLLPRSVDPIRVEFRACCHASQVWLIRESE